MSRFGIARSHCDFIYSIDSTILLLDFAPLTSLTLPLSLSPQALFSAADVDSDGKLTIDEFAEMVRRTLPSLSSDDISGLFIEAIRSSKSEDSIDPDAFAKVTHTVAPTLILIST